MIKVAIVEDEVVYSDELKSFLKKYEEEAKTVFLIDTFDTADNFLATYEKGDYQMILMDIEMPGTNGMEAAKLLREKDKEVLLFFVTNLSQYALESYEVQAFNFMVKPIVYDSFYLKLDGAIGRIKNRLDIKMKLPIRDGDKVVDKIIVVSNIRYVEVYDHYLIYHMTDEDITIRGNSLGEISKKLEPFGFALCNKSCLVNLKFITAVNKEDVYIGKDVIKISKRRKANFLYQVAQYISFG